MRRGFIKDGKIKYFIVKGNKVIATVLIAGKYISNPTMEEFLDEGWKEYIPPTFHIPPPPEPYIPTYAELVEQYIREHGYPTYGAELAVLNNYTCDAETYAEEYNTYMQVRQDAKQCAYDYLHPITPEPAEDSTNKIEESNGEEVSVEEPTEETIEEEVTNENPIE